MASTKPQSRRCASRLGTAFTPAACHRIRLGRRPPSGRRRHPLLTSTEAHPPGLLAYQPRYVGLDIVACRATGEAELIAQALRLFEIERGGGRFHPQAELFNFVGHSG